MDDPDLDSEVDVVDETVADAVDVSVVVAVIVRDPVGYVLVEVVLE